MTTEVHPRVERIMRECIGRIRGKFMYTETEAVAAIRAVLAKPVRRKNNGYIASGDAPNGKPWNPGDPKPGHS